MVDESKLLTVKETCEYLRMGSTKVREILNSRDCTFRVRIGNRLYANRQKLDKWIDSISGTR